MLFTELTFSNYLAKVSDQLKMDHNLYKNNSMWWLSISMLPVIIKNSIFRYEKYSWYWFFFWTVHFLVCVMPNYNLTYILIFSSTFLTAIFIFRIAECKSRKMVKFISFNCTYSGVIADENVTKCYLQTYKRSMKSLMYDYGWKEKLYEAFVS